MNCPASPQVAYVDEQTRRSVLTAEGTLSQELLGFSFVIAPKDKDKRWAVWGHNVLHSELMQAATLTQLSFQPTRHELVCLYRIVISQTEKQLSSNDRCLVPLLQLFHSDSIISTTKRSAEKWRVFERAGLFGMAVSSTLGTMTFLFLDLGKIVRATTLATAITASIAVGGERNVSCFVELRFCQNDHSAPCIVVSWLRLHGALDTALGMVSQGQLQ